VLAAKISSEKAQKTTQLIRYNFFEGLGLQLFWKRIAAINMSFTKLIVNLRNYLQIK
jgi:hypothetical protein